MIEAAPFSGFSISIYWLIDILFKLQSTARSMKIRMLQLSKENHFVFQ